MQPHLHAAVLFLLVSAGFAALAVHPFSTYPASLALYRVWRKRRAAGTIRAETPAPIPRMALLVSAYNEEEVIEAKARNLIASAEAMEGTDILVYVDGSDDDTAKLLKPFADRIKIFSNDARRGKSHGLEVLTAATDADVLVFSDANVSLKADSLRKLADRFTDASVGCVSGHLVYDNEGESATANAGGLYWRVEEAIQRLESDTIGMVGVDGSLFAVRRHLKPRVPADLIDDFYVSMHVAMAGHKVIKADDAYAYERSASDSAEEFSRKIRVGCQSFNVHRAIWSEVVHARAGIVYGYVSHRLLKWLIAYNFGVSALFFFLAASCVMPAGFLAGATIALVAIAALAFAVRLPGTDKAWAVGSAFVGAAAGVARSLAGERYQTWQPMRTTRTPSHERISS